MIHDIIYRHSDPRNRQGTRSRLTVESLKIWIIILHIATSMWKAPGRLSITSFVAIHWCAFYTGVQGATVFFLRVLCKKRTKYGDNWIIVWKILRIGSQENCYIISIVCVPVQSQCFFNIVVLSDRKDQTIRLYGILSVFRNPITQLCQASHTCRSHCYILKFRVGSLHNKVQRWNKKIRFKYQLSCNSHNFWTHLKHQL